MWNVIPTVQLDHVCPLLIYNPQCFLVKSHFLLVGSMPESQKIPKWIWVATHNFKLGLIIPPKLIPPRLIPDFEAILKSIRGVFPPK